MAYKNSAKTTEDEERYTQQYREKLRRSFRDSPDLFFEILYGEDVTFMCYCPAGKFCHRHLLTDMFVRMGKVYNVEVIYKGEIV